MLPLILSLLISVGVSAKPTNQLVLGDLSLLKKVGAKIIDEDSEIQVGFAEVTSSQMEQISEANHEKGRCAGFELVEEEIGLKTSKKQSPLKLLRERVEKDQRLKNLSLLTNQLQKRAEIEEALLKIDPVQIRSKVEWLSSYPTRDHRTQDPNIHVRDFEASLKNQFKDVTWAKVEQISHSRTKQNSLKVRLEGRLYPNEIVVMGGHLDSIVQGFGGGGGRSAPGADDNASGSAALAEALRILMGLGQPERSIEIFWYAGEEGGLIGSGEIAANYKRENKDVIAVLQLDMVLHAGSGELTIANITDFTSPWLREILIQINSHYIGARLVEDRCGYACSDHASWYRQGFPTAMPFEAMTRNINNKIHTPQDQISASSNFTHAAAFSKMALALAMELGNSRTRQP